MMKIQDKHLYHGAALAQIVEHPRFTALNKCDDKYGHYLLNHDVRLMVKYSSADAGPWLYNFHPDDIRVLREDFAQQVRTFVCLVAGEAAICLLSAEDVRELIDLESTEQQPVRVESPPGGSMRVSSRERALRRTVPHNAFPDRLFAPVEATAS